MAQSSESIQSQPPPEVRLDKLQPDIHHSQQEPQPQPQPQIPLNGDRTPPSAAVASRVQSSISNDLDKPDYKDETRSDKKHGSATGSGIVEARSTGHTGATVSAPRASPKAAEGSIAQLDGSHGGQDGVRNSGDAPLSLSPPMSGPQPPPAGQHRQGQTAYSNPAPYQPSSSMHAGAQYAYQTQIPQQQHDPYRASPTSVNSSMALPSMRTFDHQQQPQQQQPPQPQAYAMAVPMGQAMPGPMGGQMGMPPQGGMASGPVGIGYYSNSLPPNPYGMQVDSNGVRYAILPEIDPRIILANRQKKVPIPSILQLPSLVSKKDFLLTIEIVVRAGNQAQNQDGLFDMPKTKNKGACLPHSRVFPAAHSGSSIWYRVTTRHRPFILSVSLDVTGKPTSSTNSLQHAEGGKRRRKRGIDWWRGNNPEPLFWGGTRSNDLSFNRALASSLLEIVACIRLS